MKETFTLNFYSTDIPKTVCATLPEGMLQQGAYAYPGCAVPLPVTQT